MWIFSRWRLSGAQPLRKRSCRMTHSRPGTQEWNSTLRSIMRHLPNETELTHSGWIIWSHYPNKSSMYHIFHDSFCQYCVNRLINPTVSDVTWLQMTFIPEELGIKSLNRANFWKYFNGRRFLLQQFQYGRRLK
jgi:hypothetical protein